MLALHTLTVGLIALRSRIAHRRLRSGFGSRTNCRSLLAPLLLLTFRPLRTIRRLAPRLRRTDRRLLAVFRLDTRGRRLLAPLLLPFRTYGGCVLLRLLGLRGAFARHCRR